MQPFSERLYSKAGLSTHLQQVEAYSESAQFPENTSIDRYLYPFSLPVWQKPGMTASGQQFFTTGVSALGTPFARGYVIC